MRISNKFTVTSRMLASAFILTLTAGFVSPIAANASPGQNLSTVPETITTAKSNAFIGDADNPTITSVISSTGVTADTDYVYVSMFDMDTGKYMGGCEDYRNTPLSCTVSLSGTDNTAVLEGDHHYQVFAEYFPATQWGRIQPTKLDDLGSIASKSAVVSFERKPFSLRLENTPYSYFTGMTADWPDAYLNQKVNGTEDYGIYVFDLTDGRFLGQNGAQSDWAYGGHPEFRFGNPHYYQSFLAEEPRDSSGVRLEVTKLNDLTKIIASSNIISLTRNPWSVEIVDDVNQTQVNTTQGGGSYGTYLVDDYTGKVIWNDIDRNEPLFGPNPYGLPGNQWATAYVARTWLTSDGGDGKKPAVKEDLLDIQATSKKYVKPAGSATISTSEIAGGTNPSEPCAQGCQGDPVNMATGEFFDTKTDLITAGHGLKATASRNFSTTNKDILSPLGYGWNPSAKLSLSSVNNLTNIGDDSVIKINQENGSTVIFHKNPDGTYETGSKTQATLNRNASNGQFTFIRNKTETFSFDNTGKILSQKDIYNNTLTYTYNGANISKIVDGYGNTLTYAYNTSGLIASITDQNGQSVIYTYDLAKKLLTSVKDSTGITFSYTYDTSRRVKTLTNALGGITTNTYDTSHRVTQQKDPLGRLLKFAYSGTLLNQTVTITQPDLSKSQEVYENGQLTMRTLDFGTSGARSWKYYYGETNQVISVINPDNTNTSAMYDANGNITRATDAKGNTSSFTYNSVNKVLTATNALNQTVTNTYDATGNLLTSSDPQGHVTSFAYNPDGTVLKATDPRGNKSGANPDDYSSTFGYSTKGLLTQTIDAKGNKTTVSLDNLGRAISTIDPRGYEAGNSTSDYSAKIAYNSLNLPSKITDPLLNETNLTYDNMGNVLTSKDALNNVTTYTFDVMGNMLTSKNALNQVTTYTYDAMNRVSTITDANGKISTITYDTSGRVKETKDPLNRITKQEWNSVDKLTASVDPANNRTEYTYDFSGNMSTSKDALGSLTTYSYDSLNRVSKIKDAEGRVIQKEYDSVGHLIKTTNPDGTTETIGYDEVGNPISTTNGAGKTQTWAYDSLNRKTSYTNEINQTTSYTYDASSHVKQETRNDGSSVSYSYGRTGLLDAVDYPGTDADLAYTYDVLGRSLTEQKGTSPVSTYAYDAIGQLTSRGPPSSKVSYTYGATGNVDTLTYPSGRVVTYVRDDASQVSSLQTAGIGTIGFGYDTRGLATSVSLPSGVTENRVYDVTGKLTEKDIKNGTSSLYKKTQSYTATGNVKQRSITDPSSGISTPKLEDFVYDPMSRITANKDTVQDYSINGYSYNASGNLKTIGSGTSTSSYIFSQNFDDSGKIIGSGGKSLGYDSRNNRTSLIDPIDLGTGMTYRWGVNNTLDSVTKKVNWSYSVISYSYTASGLLEKKTAPGKATSSFVWDENSAIPLMLSDGEYEYIYGIDRVPVAQVKISDGSVTYLHTDLNGSVTASTSASGVVVATTDYSPYGKRTKAPISRFGYAGDWTDPDTGYTYLRNRWLDTTTGTFLSEDPMVQITGNSFGYTNGNPLLQIDPMGLCSFTQAFNIGSDCYNFMDTKGFKSFANTAAGAGDSVLMGMGPVAREALGAGNVIDTCSAEYNNAETNASLAMVFVPGGGVVKGLNLGSKGLRVVNNSGKVFDNVYEMGGRYGDLTDPIKGLGGVMKKNSLEAHHMPSTKWLLEEKVSTKADGLAIVISKADHKLTRTHSGKSGSAYLEDRGKSYKEVLQRDLRDLKSISGDKYDVAIMKVLREAKTRGLI